MHRDVKPANIIIPRNGRPKITDFGIARLGEADVLAGSRAGSPKLHVARADPGRWRPRRAQRHLLARRGPLRDAHRAAAVRRRRGGRHHAHGATGHPSTPERAQRTRAAGARRARAANARQAARRATPERTLVVPRAAPARRQAREGTERRRTPRRRPGAESLGRRPDLGDGRRARGAGRSTEAQADETLRRPACRGRGCRAGRRRRDRPCTVARRPAFARTPGRGADSRRRPAYRAGAARAAANTASGCAREAARARTTAEGAGARREEAGTCACRRTRACAAAGRGCRRAAQACPASPAADREDRPRGVAVGRGLRQRKAARHDAAARRGRASAGPASGRDPELRATAVSHVRRAAGWPDPADPLQFFELDPAAARSRAVRAAC